MKSDLIKYISTILLCSFTLSSCGEEKSKNNQPAVAEQTLVQLAVDTTMIDAFFTAFPLFAKQKQDVKTRYSSDNSFIWYDQQGMVEFAGVLYNQALNMNEDGLPDKLPYGEMLQQIIFDDQSEPSQQSELLLSSLYFYYTDKVFRGLPDEQSRQTSWYLPRENRSYASLLDSLVSNPRLLSNGKAPLLNQYYNLRIALKKYRNIEKVGGWPSIEPLPKNKVFVLGDTSIVIKQVRNRLFIEGYLKSNSDSEVFDDALLEGIGKFHLRHNRESDHQVNSALIGILNVPVQERIKTITVNMERCRWISPTVTEAAEFIAVNIPSFRVHYVRNGKPVLSSKVIVGKEMNKTVVFSGLLSHIVFSPYWNVPPSILEKEIRPAIRKNPNYLSEHNMEWHDGRVRQRPGSNNSLGLVKFMFPNSNNIYLHDTPAKNLFSKDERAFSHGCIRVEKARELAIMLMEKEAGWTPDQVDRKMNAGKESTFRLRQPIPVYVAYFTAWADNEGNAAFFKDIYDRDQRLLEMLHY